MEDTPKKHWIVLSFDKEPFPIFVSLKNSLLPENVVSGDAFYVIYQSESYTVKQLTFKYREVDYCMSLILSVQGYFVDGYIEEVENKDRRYSICEYVHYKSLQIGNMAYDNIRAIRLKSSLE